MSTMAAQLESLKTKLLSSADASDLASLERILATVKLITETEKIESEKEQVDLQKSRGDIEVDSISGRRDLRARGFGCRSRFPLQAQCCSPRSPWYFSFTSSRKLHNFNSPRPSRLAGRKKTWDGTRNGAERSRPWPKPRLRTLRLRASLSWPSSPGLTDTAIRRTN